MENRESSIGKGCVQVYTGNGKGKTTAALGLAFRAMGGGLRTYFGQFMKGTKYSELSSAAMVSDHITIEQYGKDRFIHVKNPPAEEDVLDAHAGLDRVRTVMKSGDYDIIVCDEILTSFTFNLVTVEEILGLMREKPDGVELVLTGRGAPPEVIEAADLVTEMTEVKHYYTQGIQARVGIER